MDSMVLRDRLRDHGYRNTTQRQAVFDAVEALEHGTPDEILRQAQIADELLNLSTVYRNLEVLEAVGLVRHAHMGHGSPTYHLADRHRHLHLVCGACGRVQEVPVDVAHTLVTDVKKDHGFEIDIDHFAIQGTCSTCAGSA
jgi:Fur family ferric uptake transcriptional regulator